MLTKGDVLAALGKISDAKGSMKGIPKTAYGTKAGYGDVSRRRAFLFLLRSGLVELDFDIVNRSR